MSDEEQKIVVDEDFKEQVEREREQQRQAEEVAKAAGEEPGAGQEIPPASMQLLVSMLSSQVMMAMGFMPTPDGQPPQVDLPLAKHFIDLLSVLDDKTKGNLNEEEQSMLTESLHQFRMAFVQYSQGAGAEGAGVLEDGSGDGEAPKSTIELP